MFEALQLAVGEHGVLAFRDQHLTPAQHVAFSRQFGSLETHVISEALLDGYPEIYVISNVVEDGKPTGQTIRRHLLALRPKLYARASDGLDDVCTTNP